MFFYLILWVMSLKVNACGLFFFFLALWSTSYFLINETICYVGFLLIIYFNP